MDRRGVVAVALALLLTGGCAAEVATTTGAATGEAAEMPVEVLETADEVPAGVCETEARTIEVAAEAYRAGEGAYPETVDVLVGSFLREAPLYHEVELVSPDELRVVPLPEAGC